MKALVTGASSGIGKAIALKLSELGHDLVLVARSKTKLEEVSKLCNTNVEIFSLDLSVEQNCKMLFDKNKDVDILINNAGFGGYGTFSNASLTNDLNMIDLNIKAVHTLTKLYLDEMIKKNSGIILNVASTAAFLPGPLMSTYYATKSYVYSLTTAIYEELRRIKSNVKVSVLCPGPVDTNFNNVAGVTFSMKSLSSTYVANYAINKMFKNKLVIIPGFINKLGALGSKLMPLKLLLKIDYNIQKKKENDYDKK